MALTPKWEAADWIEVTSIFDNERRFVRGFDSGKRTGKSFYAGKVWNPATERIEAVGYRGLDIERITVDEATDLLIRSDRPLQTTSTKEAEVKVDMKSINLAIDMTRELTKAEDAIRAAIKREVDRQVALIVSGAPSASTPADPQKSAETPVRRRRQITLLDE